MDELNTYREIAKQKYEKFRLEKEAKEAADNAKMKEAQDELYAAMAAEQALLDAENAAKDLKFTQEMEEVDVFFIELDESINELKSSDDIFLILQIIQTRIQSIIELVREHERLSEIQDRVLVFVDIMNKSHEDSSKKKDSTYVSQVSSIVKSIFELCEVDVEIEAMDTSEDDEFARKLQEEMYSMNFYDNNPIGATGATGHNGSENGGGGGNGLGNSGRNDGRRNDIEI
jgi:hypothetical protein